MKEKIIYLLYVILLISCNSNGETFWIYNDSNKQIFIQFNYNYPYTSIPLDKEYLNKIEAHSRHAFNRSEDLDESFNEYFPLDTAMIFFFDPDTIKRYTWDEIRLGNKILRKNIYSKQELQEAGWEIHYP